MSFILKFNDAVSDDTKDTVAENVAVFVAENPERGLRAVLAKDLYLIADTKEDMHKIMPDVFDDLDIMIDNVGFITSEPEVTPDSDDDEIDDVEFAVYYFETATKKALLEALSA